jgi:hypothetical protein
VEQLWQQCTRDRLRVVSTKTSRQLLALQLPNLLIPFSTITPANPIAAIAATRDAMGAFSGS